MKQSILLEKSRTEPSTGPSTFIASDCWTLNDELGYTTYAYAVYKFLMHKDTKPPLTISIQAPWGGGKTSLMRMIQKNLDPKSCEKYIKHKRKNGNSNSNNEKINNKLTVDQVCNELKALTNGQKPEIKFPVEHYKDDQCLTIWFNAWKSENT